jgi:hypothetical protein
MSSRPKPCPRAGAATASALAAPLPRFTARFVYGCPPGPPASRSDAYRIVQRCFLGKRFRLRGESEPLGSGVPPPFVGGGPGRVESSFGPGPRQGGGASVAPSLARARSQSVINSRRPSLAKARGFPLFKPFAPLPLRSGSGATVTNFCVREELRSSKRKNE